MERRVQCVCVYVCVLHYIGQQEICIVTLQSGYFELCFGVCGSLISCSTCSTGSPRAILETPMGEAEPAYFHSGDRNLRKFLVTFVLKRNLIYSFDGSLGYSNSTCVRRQRSAQCTSRLRHWTNLELPRIVFGDGDSSFILPQRTPLAGRPQVGEGPWR